MFIQIIFKALELEMIYVTKMGIIKFGMLFYVYLLFDHFNGKIDVSYQSSFTNCSAYLFRHDNMYFGLFDNSKMPLTKIPVNEEH